MNLSKEKQVILSASKQAAKVILKYFGKNEKGKEKSNKSLVSRADLEANEVIIKTIKKSFPKHSILSEESGFENNNSDYKWVIDPIDGTHNFLRGIKEFGVSIALEYKNEAVLGVLEFPLLKLTAFAEKGKGSFLNGKRISVSGHGEIGHSFILFEFVAGTRHKTLKFLKNLSSYTLDIRNCGSAIYALAMVASGQCDAFVVFTTNEWDIAAGMLLVREAGGKASDLKGSFAAPSNGSFIFSNGKIELNLLKHIK